MMSSACRAGISPLTYWEMTPREISIAVQAYVEKENRDQEAQIISAYLTAYWQRVKRMPSLKEVLGKEKTEKKKKTPEEMLEVVKQLNEAFGGTVLK